MVKLSGHFYLSGKEESILKINEKFLIKLSISFILIGILCSMIGYALSGFDTTKYIRTNHPWYQLVQYGDD